MASFSLYELLVSMEQQMQTMSLTEPNTNVVPYSAQQPGQDQYESECNMDDETIGDKRHSSLAIAQHGTKRQKRDNGEWKATVGIYDEKRDMVMVMNEDQSQTRAPIGQIHAPIGQIHAPIGQAQRAKTIEQTRKLYKKPDINARVQLNANARVQLNANARVQLNADARVQLKDHQTIHCKIMLDRFSFSPVAFDVSRTGAGKTPATCYIAQFLAQLQAQFFTTTLVQPDLSYYQLLILCPLSVKSNWQDHADKYHVPVIDILTYEKLRGRTKTELSHPYLVRIDIPKPKQSKESKTNYETEYKPTHKWIEMCRTQRVLLVIDEAQRGKNDTSTSQAVAALSAPIVKCIQDMTLDTWEKDNQSGQHRSRVLLLSATLFDKKEHAEQMLRITGFLTGKRLTDATKAQMTARLYMMQKAAIRHQQRIAVRDMQRIAVRDMQRIEVQDKINSSDEKEKPATIPVCTERGADANDKWMHECVTQILKPMLFSSMSPPKLKFPNMVKNLYIAVHSKYAEEMMELIVQLGQAVRKMKSSKGKAARESMAQVTVFLHQIETKKVPIMLALAKQYLSRSSQTKIILFVWYLDSVDFLRRQFESMGYKSLALHGSVNDDDRADAIRNFNRPDGEYRVFIAITQVGSVGINLQDQDGRWPRFSIGIPHYRIIDMHQAAGRTYRTGTMSQPETVFLYVQCEGEIVEEASLLKSIAEKSGVMDDLTSQTTAKQDDEDEIVYPGRYPNVCLTNLLFDAQNMQLTKIDPSCPVEERPIG
jgi:hypothetical protein